MTGAFGNIEDVDVDGAIRETAERVDGHTRTAFLRKAGLGAGMLVGGSALIGALPELASAAAYERHRHPELRADARVSRVGVLRGSRQDGRAQGRDEDLRKGRRGPRGAARRCAQERARLRGGGNAEVRLQGHDRRPGEVRGHLRGARVHGRQRLPRPGRKHHARRRCSARPARSSRSRRGTQPGSPTSAGTAPSPTRLRRRSRSGRRRLRSSPRSREPASSSADRHGSGRFGANPAPSRPLPGRRGGRCHVASSGAR